MLQPILAQVSPSATGSLHRTTGWYVVGVMAALGLWGLALTVARKPPRRASWAAFGVGVSAMLGQVGMGVYALSVDGVEPGNQHVFYGVVSVFTLAFAYIYRAQLAKRPALSYALLSLFLMGLGMRAIGNFGQSF
jgi:uncharacterized membrane protein